MNNPTEHSIPISRPQAARPQPTPEQIIGLSRICSELLDAELQFYQRLEKLLLEMTTVNLFVVEAATSITQQMEGLHQERNQLNRDRFRCQRALAVILQQQADNIRMSALEERLPAELRAELRQRRGRVASCVKVTQQLLRRTDRLLIIRGSLFSELIFTLTGQSPSANCYGAHGRREQSVPFSRLEAVS